MNLSNRLTLSRIFLTIIFVIALSMPLHWGHTIALATFALAALTDWLDGYDARRYEICTNFGRLMDPLADKILVAAALISLISFDAFPSWIVIVIIAREFLITGLRLLAVDRGVILAADALGKQKTVWQLTTILFYLSLLALGDFFQSPWIAWGWIRVGSFLIGITLFFTLASAMSYLWKNRTLLH